MGSLDPLPAGFEIQFGSLNFQATGNDSPTVTNSVRGGKKGQSRSPPHPSPRHQHPTARMLRAP
jgi:hypothetical protein